MTRRQRRRIEKDRRHAEVGLRGGGRRIAAGAGLTVGATLAMAGVAQATDYTVGSLADTSGASDCTTPTNTDCTLRQAIIDANANSGADQILFKASLSGTIIFGTEPPFVTGPTDIIGPGAGQLAVDGNGAHKVFDVQLTVAGDPVSISDLTIQNSCCAGGIRSQNANLSVSDMVITGNSAIGGGAGISSHGPSLTVDRSTVSGNTQSGGNAGGGIFAYYELTLRDSTVSGNTAGTDGGGVYVGYSGGTYYRGPHLISNSTIVGNTAGRDGGGVNFCGSVYQDDRLTIDSSTITGNDAAGTALSGGGYGGGVASGCGDGYYGASLDNSIVADNTAAVADPDVSAYSPVDASFSLIGEDSGGISEGVAGSNITGVDPLVAPLANNGGPTNTQAIPESSPAVDQGNSDLPVDQRNEPRPFDVPGIPASAASGADSSDIGAFERQSDDGIVPILTVLVGGGGSGNVTAPGIDCAQTGGDCAGAFNPGNVLLTATAGPGSSFAGWVDCDNPSANQCTMDMNADKSVGASFVPTPAGGGPTPPPPSGTTPSGRAAAIARCKKKFPKGPKRKKCIKKAKKRFPA